MGAGARLLRPPKAQVRGKYNLQLLQVISLDDAPRVYGGFDAVVPKKFVIDPHKLFSAA